MRVAELDFFQQLDGGITTIEKVLNPVSHISDFNTDDLIIEVLPTGFPSFDENLVLKKNRGELILIGARPSHGKSAMLFQMATSIARTSKVLIFSLEMDKESIITRQISPMINRPIQAIQMGIHKRDVENAKQDLKLLNLYIDDRSGITVEDIAYTAREENRRGKLSAIFIDYVQIIGSEKGHSRASEVSVISAALKSLAKELRVPVIVASQLNRNGDTRENKTPQLSDLKESGALEQDADVVILLQRVPDFPKEATVIIAKNRNGPTKEIQMGYAPAQTLFIDTGDASI